MASSAGACGRLDEGQVIGIDRDAGFDLAQTPTLAKRRALK